MNIHITFIFLLGIFVATLNGCSHRPSIRFASQLSSSKGSQTPLRLKTTSSGAGPTVKALRPASDAAQFASTLVGQSHAIVNGKSYRGDCSGTVRAIYDYIGISFGGSTTSLPENDVLTIYNFVEKNGVIFQENPAPGDLVFFDNTYDVNRDGKLNDKLSHAGVVEQILPDETILFVHYMGNSIIRSRMNLKHPSTQINSETQDRLNHMLRRTSDKGKGLTTAQLFVGFGRISDHSIRQ